MSATASCTDSHGSEQLVSQNTDGADGATGYREWINACGSQYYPKVRWEQNISRKNKDQSKVLKSLSGNTEQATFFCINLNPLL